MGLKILANLFTTASGRKAMEDPERARSLIDFCNKSFGSCNHKVAFHSALALFNYLLAFENADMTEMQPVIQLALVGINYQVLSKPEITDKDTLMAVLLCQCRLLYKNHELTSFVEQEFKGPFKATMNALEDRASAMPVEVKQAIRDLTNMVNLEDD